MPVLYGKAMAPEPYLLSYKEGRVSSSIQVIKVFALYNWTIIHPASLCYDYSTLETKLLYFLKKEVLIGEFGKKR